MPRRIQRRYYRLLVSHPRSLQGLGSDFNGAVRLDPAPRAEAECLASLTRRGLHAPVLDLEYPARVRLRGRYFLLELEPRTLNHEALKRLHEALIRARLSTRTARRLTRSHRVSDRSLVTLAFHVPIHLTASRTPGHHHLYIDREIKWEHYLPILIELEEARLIEYQLLSSYLIEETSFIRLPAPH